MSWMTKDDEIQILKNENSELKSIIEVMKKELRKEREAVDYFASEDSWNKSNLGFNNHLLKEVKGYRYPTMRARETQAKRKVVL